MSKYERNMDYLNRRKIIYRRNPTTDKPTATYEWGDFYEYGTHEYYALFQSKAKITTYRSLLWHLIVLWYLNLDLTQDEFKEIAWHMSQKENGFVTFNISEELFNKIFYDVCVYDLEDAPKNKPRKLVFKEFSGLSFKEKMKIVGRMVGRNSITATEIYDTMLMLYDDNEKITVAKIADSLGCSTRTVYRHMTDELKREKNLLNKEL